MATPNVYMDAIRRWIMDPNRQPNTVVADAIQALLAKATAAETAAGGAAGDITTINTTLTTLQTSVEAAQAAADDASLLVPVQWLDPDTIVQLVQDSLKVNIESGAGVPTAVRPNGSLYIRTDVSQLWRYVLGAGATTTTAVNIVGTDLIAPTNLTTFSGIDAGATFSVRKPRAAASGGLLTWDAYNVLSGAPNFWQNALAVYGNNGGSDTLLFSQAATPYSTESDAFHALADQLPQSFTGYTEYKVVGANDVSVPSDNTQGLSVLVDVTAAGGWVLMSDLTSIRLNGTEIEDSPRSLNFTGAGVSATTDGAGNVGVAIPGYTDEQVRDVIGAALVAGSNVTIAVNDAGDTITIAATAAAPLTVKDEGSTLSTAVTSLNFTGSGVTATNVGGAVTVNVPLASSGSVVASAGLVAPQGRLTLVTGVPVMVSDQTAKTHVYYTSYIGASVPVFDGTNWTQWVLGSDLDLALDTSNHLSANLYDVFVWNNGGTISIGTGPAWSSSTARGTGAGTTELQMLNGIWTNKNAITLKNGAGAGTSGIGANQATYVGTFYATANGQTGMAFKPAAATGGTNNILGLWNAYNRVSMSALCRDSTASWTYALTTARPSNNSNSNRISYVDGLAQSNVRALFEQLIGGASNGAGIAVLLDATTGTPNFVNRTLGTVTVSARDAFLPLLGLHFVQAVELAQVNITYFGSNASQQVHALVVELEM